MPPQFHPARPPPQSELSFGDETAAFYADPRVLTVSELTAPAVEYAFLFATSSGTNGLPVTKRASPVVSKTPLSMPIVVAESLPPLLNIPEAKGAPL